MRATSALVGTGLGLLLLSALPAPAVADWQYTQWGMSPAAVRAASHGAATDNADRSLDAEGLVAKLAAPYEGAHLAFTASFLFGDDDGLAAVTLTPRDPRSCALIPQILTAHHGAPLSSERFDVSTISRWQDYENDNVINFLNIAGHDCSIQYSRLANTRNDGTL